LSPFALATMGGHGSSTLASVYLLLTKQMRDSALPADGSWTLKQDVSFALWQATITQVPTLHPASCPPLRCLMPTLPTSARPAMMSPSGRLTSNLLTCGPLREAVLGAHADRHDTSRHVAHTGRTPFRTSPGVPLLCHPLLARGACVPPSWHGGHRTPWASHSPRRPRTRPQSDFPTSTSTKFFPTSTKLL
jgi:hypothetical protein